MLGLLVVAAAMVFVCMSSAVAYAAPIEPTLGVDPLAALISAAPGNVVSGYMKTVLHGSTIDTISVDILAVTRGTGLNGGDLILFQTKDPKIAEIGGIAEGMSGSPIYVPDPGGDQLVGAVSYGDAFTLHGTGLATPIDEMAKIEADYSVTSSVLNIGRTVMTDRGPVDSIVITPDATTADLFAGKRTLVVKPLGALQVGGLSANDPAFLAYQARMKKHGIAVMSGVSAMGASDASFTTTLTAGASVAAMAARGDLWVGGIGTVTYATPESVVAFGHPAFWDGNSGLEMTNAWIDGVWPSTYSPYKLGVPGAVQGTIVQDRASGILGRPGLMPTETPVTAHTVDTDTGKTNDSTTWMPRFVIDSNSYNYQGLASLAVYVGTSKIFDAVEVPGSAITTTTVVVSDGTRTYTVRRRNTFDDTQDVPMFLCNDVSEMVSELQAVNANGLAHAEIESVDVQSAITSHRNSADIVDVEAPNGLTWGPNRIRVSLLKFGISATQTVEATLTIPAGTSLRGTLSVSAASANSDFSSDPSMALFGFSSTTADRRSTSQAVDDLNAEATNSQILVDFTPVDLSGSGVASSDEPIYSAAAGLTTLATPQVLYDPVDMRVETGSYLSGYVSKTPTQLVATASARTLAYRGSLGIMGVVSGLQNPAKVLILGRSAVDANYTTLATVTVSPSGFFSTVLPGLRTNTRLIAVFPGDADTLASQASMRVNVAASVSMHISPRRIPRGTTVTLTAAVSPSVADGSVTFEYLKVTRSGSRWTAIATKAVKSGVASATFKPAASMLVRARYTGGVTNAPAVSPTSVLALR
jgi:hypothetical protein